MGASVRVLHVSEDALRLFMSLTRELLKARAERELGQDEEAARAEAIDDCWDDLTPEEVGRAEDFVRILKAQLEASECVCSYDVGRWECPVHCDPRHD